MSEILTYTHDKFGTIRTIEENGTLLFCGSDVAERLGYVKARNAISAHCKGALKRGTPTEGGIQQLLYIPEGDVYRLIVSSHLPEAEQFEHWLFDEVVPAIRRHGIYATAKTVEDMIADPDNMIKVLQALKDERERRKQLEEEARINKPMIDFAQSVSDSQGGILIREMAKLLAKEGLDIGGNRLINKLEDMGLLCKTTRGTEPTQVAVANGWLIPKESTWLNKWTGRTSVSITAMVTGKGQRYLYNKFMKERNI